VLRIATAVEKSCKRPRTFAAQMASPPKVVDMLASRRERVITRDLTLPELRPPERRPHWLTENRAIRALLSQFTLRPHGDQLCSPTARFWIFCARVLIMIMATAEAFSWGYVGSLFGTGISSYFTGLAAAVTLFFVVWLVDATFVTLDTSRAYYQRVLSSEPRYSSVAERRKFLAGLFIRAAIVVVSLWITAPFLAQIVFHRDVEDTIVSRNRAAVAATRAALTDKYEKLLRPLDSALSATQNFGILEAAGKGPSGRYGRGAAVIEIDNRIEDLQHRITSTEQERDSLLYLMNTLPQRELASRFGVPLIDQGLRSRSEVLKTMLANPDYSGAQLALRAFLSFLFLGLVILKLFQPRSIGIYYSEQLQSLYTDYSQGKFDEHLDLHDRPRSGTPMTPQRFEEWCLHSYQLVRAEDEQRRLSEQAIHTHERKMGTWVDDLRAQEDLLDEMRKRFETVSTEVITAESKLQTLSTQVETERQELARSTKTLEAITEHIATGTLDVRGVARGFAAQAKVQTVIDALEETIRMRESQISELALRVPLRREEIVRLRDEILELERGVHDLTARLTRERKAYHDWLSTQPKLSRRPVA
jgi:hypothetical protein